MYIPDYNTMTPAQQARALAEEAAQVYADAETRIDTRLAELIQAMAILVERIAGDAQVKNLLNEAGDITNVLDGIEGSSHAE